MVTTSQAGMAAQHLQPWWCSPWYHTVRYDCLTFVFWDWDSDRRLHWQQRFLGNIFTVGVL
jgi:hypothetical protein